MLIYVHKKTGNLYRHLAVAIDATNATDGRTMVVYCPLDNEHAIYVREHDEFADKFELREADKC